MALAHSAVIEDYIQRVTELSQSTQRIPTVSELEAIATELGIEPEEIRAAQQQAADHFTRAQGYLRLNYWEDAITELQEAIAFSPSQPELLLFLARAHLGRWRQSHQKQDAEQLHLIIRQCLSLEPGCEDALNVLADFRHSQERRFRLLGAMVFFAGAILCGGFGYLLVQGGLLFVIEEKTRLENLEAVIERQNEELKILAGEQQALRRQLQTATDRQSLDSRHHGDRLEQMQSQIKVLEQKIKNLQALPPLDSQSPSQAAPGQP
jgi:hypothetical protein